LRHDQIPSTLPRPLRLKPLNSSVFKYCAIEVPR
jgi:hypothetical protein